MSLETMVRGGYLSDEMRKAFESWFSKAYPNGVILGQLARYERGDTLLLPSIQAVGDYKNSWVQGSWEGWRGACADHLNKLSDEWSAAIRQAKTTEGSA